MCLVSLSGASLGSLWTRLLPRPAPARAEVHEALGGRHNGPQRLARSCIGSRCWKPLQMRPSHPKRKRCPLTRLAPTLLLLQGQPRPKGKVEGKEKEEAGHKPTDPIVGIVFHAPSPQGLEKGIVQRAHASEGDVVGVEYPSGTTLYEVAPSFLFWSPKAAEGHLADAKKGKNHPKPKPLPQSDPKITPSLTPRLTPPQTAPSPNPPPNETPNPKPKRPLPLFEAPALGPLQNPACPCPYPRGMCTEWVYIN